MLLTPGRRPAAPSENFGWSSWPPLAEFERQVARTAGPPLAAAEALTAARAFHAEMGLPPGAEGTGGLLLTGHQPELFHPGVWAKNVALFRLARRCGLTPLNLIVDTDLVKSTSVRVPDLRLPPGHVFDVAYAVGPFDQPHETWRVDPDSEELTSFPEQVAAHLAGVAGRPLVADFWPMVLAAVRERTACLGWALASARRLWEERWGIHNWEVPLSRLCALPSFARFLGEIAARPHEFHESQATALAGFRKRYRLRSRSHPFPDLQRREATWELPFWVWSDQQPRRQRLFGRQGGVGAPCELGWWTDAWQPLPVPWPESVDRQPDALAELTALGWRLRSRALATTLFARRCLGQGFIHGLGGGLYDQVTDELMTTFFGLPAPPPYLTLTATLHLRAEGVPAASDQVRELKQRAWSARWHAERLLAQEPEAGEAWLPLGAEKRAWIEREPASRAERRQRCQALKAINHKLAASLQPWQERWTAELETAQAAACLERLCRDRDWSFVLHDADDLSRLMASIAV
ncbi:MAG TPA: hypothetical protein PKD86_06695 [Gemmatales bacterium]|nr:hypothetical protein [Gemmatales bacterium]